MSAVAATRLVLVVEDDAAHAELIRRASEAHGGHAIVRVADGEAALDYLHQRGAYDEASAVRPDAVLLDLRLPRRDGFEVLREIRASQALSALPVVVLTTSGAERDMREAYRCGANSYLVKPMGFTGFREMFGAFATYWLEHNRAP